MASLSTLQEMSIERCFKKKGLLRSVWRSEKARLTLKDVQERYLESLRV